MSLISLALVLGSTISTCQYSGNANLLENITDDLINEAIIEINKFDYSNYELSLEQSQSFIQQKLYRFAEVNSLFDDTQLESLKKIIQEEDYFVNLGNIDKVFLQNENDFEIEFPFPGGDHEIPGPGINFPNIRPLVAENNFEFVTSPGGGGGTGGDSGNNNNLLEIKPVNESNISVSLAGSIQGQSFFGIMCSKDACITVYNAIANRANNRVTDETSGESYTLGGIIFKAIREAAELTKIGATISVLITKTYNALISYFNSIIKLLINTIKKGVRYLKIIASIVILIGTSIIAILVTMIVYGLREMGFYAGWFIYNIFDWRWACGEFY